MRIHRAFHPLLFGLFPVLFLYSQNADQFPIRVVFKPAVFCVTGTVLAWGVCALLLGSRKKGALVTSVGVLLFFTYKPMLALLERPFLRLAAGNLEPQHLIGTAFLLVFAAVGVAIWKVRRLPDSLSKILNMASVCLVAMPLVHIAAFHIRCGGSGRGAGGTAQVFHEAPGPAEGPDIYYIILDGYARTDVLEEIYGYDNSAFITYLKDRGFYVAGRSRSNYGQTGPSLASSLNMTYLDDLTADISLNSNDRRHFARLISESEVISYLRDRGYTFAALSSLYHLVDMQDADLYLPVTSLNQFERGMIAATPLTARDCSWDEHRELISSTFDEIPRLSRFDGPLLVFAHVVAPHPPFVFGPDGEEITPRGQYTMADGTHLVNPGGMSWNEYRSGYLGQLQHVNTMVINTIDAILAGSGPEPVIIIQADHGPGSMLDHESLRLTCLTERFGILNAYRLPGVSPERLYDTISPVNSFRVVLNEYFGAGLELLDDLSYYATWQRPYEFFEVTDAISRENVRDHIVRARSSLATAEADTTVRTTRSLD